MSDDELKSNDQLREVIIKTIAFFDMFDYPLTAYEIYFYLDKRVPLKDIVEVLPIISKVDLKNGFYFLSEREEIITIRQKRHNYSVRKIKIALRFIRLFSILPFIRVIALANSIGQHNLRDESDIDLFIITSARRVWLTRFFCASLTKLLNRRPTEKNKQDKICLSFYISTEHLNLKHLKLPSGDPYFEYWQRSLVLLYNKDKTYENFLRANNLLNLSDNNLEKVSDFQPTPKKESQTLNQLENFLKKYQLKIMPLALRAVNNLSTGVVTSASVIKLYAPDRRQEYFDKYEQKLRGIF